MARIGTYRRRTVGSPVRGVRIRYRGGSAAAHLNQETKAAEDTGRRETLQQPDTTIPGRQPGVYHPVTRQRLVRDPWGTWVPQQRGIEPTGPTPLPQVRPNAQGAPMPGTAGPMTGWYGGQSGAERDKYGPMGRGWYGAPGGTKLPQVRPNAQGAPMPGTAQSKPNQGNQGFRGAAGGPAGMVAPQPNQRGPMTGWYGGQSGAERDKYGPMGRGWYGAPGGTKQARRRQYPLPPAQGNAFTRERGPAGTGAAQQLMEEMNTGIRGRTNLEKRMDAQEGVDRQGAQVTRYGERVGVLRGGRVVTREDEDAIRAERQARFEGALIEARRAAGIVNPEEEAARKNQELRQQKQQQQFQQRLGEDIAFELDHIKNSRDYRQAPDFGKFDALVREYQDAGGDIGALSQEVRWHLRNPLQAEQEITKGQEEKRAAELNKKAGAGYEFGTENKEPAAMDAAFRQAWQAAGGDPNRLTPEFKAMYEERQRAQGINQARSGALGQAQGAEEYFVRTGNELLLRYQDALDNAENVRFDVMCKLADADSLDAEREQEQRLADAEAEVARLESSIMQIQGALDTVRATQLGLSGAPEQPRQPWETPGNPQYEAKRKADEAAARQKAADEAKARSERIDKLSEKFDALEGHPEEQEKFALQVAERDPGLLPDMPKVSAYLDLLKQGYPVNRSKLSSGEYEGYVDFAETLLYGTKYTAMEKGRLTVGGDSAKPTAAMSPSAVPAFEVEGKGWDKTVTTPEQKYELWLHGDTGTPPKHMGLNRAYKALWNQIKSDARSKGLDEKHAEAMADREAQPMFMKMLEPHPQMKWAFIMRNGGRGMKWVRSYAEEPLKGETAIPLQTEIMQTTLEDELERAEVDAGAEEDTANYSPASLQFGGQRRMLSERSDEELAEDLEFALDKTKWPAEWKTRTISGKPWEGERLHDIEMIKREIARRKEARRR